MTSQNSKKRKLTENSNADQTSPVPIKKQRIEPQTVCSKVLSNEADQTQFASILEAIKSSPLVLKSEDVVPLCVIKEIAEYGTGDVKECANPNCDHSVIVLKADDHFECWRQGLYEYDWNEKVFYCADCIKLLRWCSSCPPDMGCDRFVKSWECDKCAQCGNVLFNCHEYNRYCRNERDRSYHCHTCPVKICGKCAGWEGQNMWCYMCMNCVCNFKLTCYSNPMRRK